MRRLFIRNGKTSILEANKFVMYFVIIALRIFARSWKIEDAENAFDVKYMCKILEYLDV